MDQESKENIKNSIRKLVKNGKQIRFTNSTRTSNTTQENDKGLPFDQANKSRFLRLRTSESIIPKTLKS